MCIAKTGHVVQACVSHRLILNCTVGSLIQIRDVKLAESDCYGRGRCCPVKRDCTGAPSIGHVTTVKNSCNNLTTCAVAVEQKKVPCGYFNVFVYNDYERVTFDCIGKPSCIVSRTNKSNICGIIHLSR